MERPSPEQREELGAEREPQPHDVALATQTILRELAPEADRQDIEENVAAIAEAVDGEEAEGIAAGCFAFFDVDPDEGLARLAEILQFQAVLPYGDQIREAEKQQD